MKRTKRGPALSSFHSASSGEAEVPNDEELPLEPVEEEAGGEGVEKNDEKLPGISAAFPQIFAIFLLHGLKLDEKERRAILAKAGTEKYDDVLAAIKFLRLQVKNMNTHP